MCICVACTLSKKNCTGQVKQARNNLFKTTAIGKRDWIHLSWNKRQESFKHWRELLEECMDFTSWLPFNPLTELLWENVDVLCFLPLQRKVVWCPWQFYLLSLSLCPVLHHMLKLIFELSMKKYFIH